MDYVDILQGGKLARFAPWPATARREARKVVRSVEELETVTERLSVLVRAYNEAR